MFLCFCYSQFRLFAMLLWLPGTLFAHGWRQAPTRLILFIFFLPLFLLLQNIHWFGFLMDVVFFSQWKQTEINRPLFITGIPRSGTTHLQRTLAKDPQFTVTPMWEVVLAPSICEKIFWSRVIKLLNPIKHSLTRKQTFIKSMDSIHRIGLHEAEEDFLFLLPLNACFVLVALFPTTEGIWRLSDFDGRLNDWEKKIIMRYYRACVQKHLYYQRRRHPDRSLHYLSKNPSFTSLLTSIRNTFPDAQFVLCVRQPENTVPSQISSLLPAFKLCGGGKIPSDFTRRCITMLQHYYQRVMNDKQDFGTPVVEMSQLKNALDDTVDVLYRKLNRMPHPEFKKALQRAADSSSQYRSAHRYQLEDFGLDKTAIARKFEGIWPITSNLEPRV